MLILPLSSKQLSRKKYRFYVGNPKDPVGSATLLKSPELNVLNLAKIRLPQTSWVLDEITVKEQFRGMGYGTSLLEYLIPQTQAIAELPIVLMPPKSEFTSRIIAWYKRHGFAPTPQLYLQYPSKPKCHQK